MKIDVKLTKRMDRAVHEFLGERAEHLSGRKAEWDRSVYCVWMKASGVHCRLLSTQFDRERGREVDPYKVEFIPDY